MEHTENAYNCSVFDTQVVFAKLDEFSGQFVVRGWLISSLIIQICGDLENTLLLGRGVCHQFILFVEKLVETSKKTKFANVNTTFYIPNVSS